MAEFAWLISAMVMNASTSSLVFLLSCLVQRRYPEASFAWWARSAGIFSLGTIILTLTRLESLPHGLSLLVAATTALSGIGFVACGLSHRGKRLPLGWMLGVALLATAASGGLYLAGLDDRGYMVPALLVFMVGLLSLGGLFWPRRGEWDGLGAWIVAVSALLGGLHYVNYPLLVLIKPQLAPIGIWIAAFLNVGMGVGMLLHRFETAHEREQQLGRQLSQANQELLRTLSALTDSRSEAMLSATVAREQGALVRQIVHDLRNATQAISLISEDLEEEAGDNDRLLRSIAALDRQVRFISNFLKEKLAWVVNREAQAGEGTELSTGVEAVVARFEPIIATRRQTLLAEPMPEARLSISPVQFEQILGNLLHNAHTHCPEGTLIRTWVAVSDGWATFYVADNGPGIPLSRQADLGRSAPRANGSGVGLMNVHDLTTAAGGLFGVVSEEGHGSTFYVTLPLISWGLQPPGERTPAQRSLSENAPRV